MNMEVKYGICDEVFWLNTSSGKVEKAEVAGVRIVPTGISKDAEGRNVCDGHVVLYETADRGPVLTEQECFASEAECRGHWKSVLSEG